MKATSRTPVLGGVGPGPRTGRSRGRRAHIAGFTLVELLVVMAIVAVLASMLLPALTRAKGVAEGGQCLANTRGLLFGWLLYADDHDGRLAPNVPHRDPGWISGVLNFDTNHPDNTNTVMLLDRRFARLGPYAADARVFKCPADRSRVTQGGRRFDRVRTVSMNAAVGLDSVDNGLAANRAYRIYQNLAQVTSPSPDRLWVLMDEHPDSLDDGSFETDLESRGRSGYFYSWPAGLHHDGANVGFADGHVERHHWLDERTRHELRYCGCLASYAKGGFFTKVPGNPDLAWIQERTSSPLR